MKLEWPPYANGMMWLEVAFQKAVGRSRASVPGSTLQISSVQMQLRCGSELEPDIALALHLDRVEYAWLGRVNDDPINAFLELDRVAADLAESGQQHCRHN